MKNKKVDMIWRYDRGNEIIYELAIESQQSPVTDLIRNDIKKLVMLPANLKVLYCSVKALDDIITVIKDELRQDEETSGSFLAIVDPWVGSRAFSKGILNGVLLDRSGLLIGEGSAKVQEINDSAHSVRMFLEAKWQYKDKFFTQSQKPNELMVELVKTILTILQLMIN